MGQFVFNLYLFPSFQVMHIAAAMEINSRVIPSLKTLHSTLNSKVRILIRKFDIACWIDTVPLLLIRGWHGLGSIKKN